MEHFDFKSGGVLQVVKKTGLWSCGNNCSLTQLVYTAIKCYILKRKSHLNAYMLLLFVLL